MKKVHIIPSALYVSGTAPQLLAELGVGPILQTASGIRCQMTQAQIDLWMLKGGAHRLEILPDVEESQPPA